MEILTMRKSLIVGCAAVGLFSSAAVSACELDTALQGQVESSRISNQWDGGTYNTYLIRDASGENYGNIRYVLSPARWGFDMRSADGRLLATVSKETIGDDGLARTQWVVHPGPDHEDRCKGKVFTLDAATASEAHAFRNGTLIGRITDFPFHESF